MKYFGDAVILCGGKSNRTRFDKSLVKINGKSLVEIVYEKISNSFERIALCANTKEKFSMFNLEVIEDILKGKGPAVAIYSALSQATTKYVFVVACDMPFINSEHIEFMKSAIEEKNFPDALIPLNGEYIEPLYGFYSLDMLKTFEEEIKKGNYKIHSILKKSNAFYLEEKYSKVFDKNLSMFTNLNYREDFEELL